RFSRDWSSDVCSSDLFTNSVDAAIVRPASRRDAMFVERIWRGHSVPAGRNVTSVAQTIGPCGSDKAPLLASPVSDQGLMIEILRSEERRVGKECRSLW